MQKRNIFRTSATFAVTLVTVFAAAMLRWLLDPLLGDHLPYATFFVAIIFGAWYGGLRPALLATILGFFVSQYFFVQPRFSFYVTTSQDRVGLLMYFLVGLSIALFGESMRVAKNRSFEQAERWKATIASIGDAVITTDADGRVSSMNALAEMLTGWMLGDARGKPLEAVFVIVDEETRQPVENPASKALKEGVVVGLANHTILIGRDGVERFIDDSAAPIRTAEGEIVGSVLVFRDISERRELERQIADQLKETLRIASVVESSDDAIVGKSLEGIIQNWNNGAERIFGYTREQAVGQPISLIIPVDRAKEEEKILSRLRIGERIEPFETVRLRSDGQLIDVSISVSPIKDELGRIIGASKIARDIGERKRSGEALRASEERLRGILRQSPAGIVQTDATGKMTLVNECWCKMLEYSEAELLGKNVLDITHSSSVEATKEVVSRLAAGGPDYQIEKNYQRKDGSMLTAQSNVTALRSSVGEFLGLIAVVLDISERVRVEQTQRQNVGLFAKIIEQAPGGVYVVDSKLRLRELNKEAIPVFAAVQPAIGRELEEALTILWGPVVGRQCTEIFRTTLETGERFVSPRFENRRFDIGVEQAYEWETQRITLPDGQHGVVCYFQDVTDQRRAERELHESEDRMRLATEATGVGIWEWNVLTNQIRWDAMMFQIYGLAPTADGFVQYDQWSEAVLPEDLKEQESILQDTVRRLGRSNRTFRIQRRGDGAIRHIKAVETVRTNAEGHAEWVVGTNLDVTELTQNQEELRRLADELSNADRRKDEFLATLAHELRNPLAPIRNGLQILSMAGENEDAADAARSMMERQLDQMVRLVDDLMDVSRISTGKIELRKERIRLQSVIDSAVESSRSIVEQMRHELTVVVPEYPVTIEADMTRLEQILLNLLNNAAKYSDPGGQIRLTAECHGTELVLTIKDTGIGITADQLSGIFDMFSQLEHSMEKSQGGLGIGLCLVRRLVELHGGSIEAFSEGTNKGAEFIVRLPMVVDTSPFVAAEVLPQKAFNSKLRILVVDDNRDSAKTLSMMLNIMGNETMTAYDGEQAVAMTPEFRPDVILLDIGLPKMSGYEACRRIRELSHDTNVLIIAQTGWGQAEDRQRTKDAGFDHHLVKPIDAKTLTTILSSLHTPKT